MKYIAAIAGATALALTIADFVPANASVDASLSNATTAEDLDKDKKAQRAKYKGHAATYCAIYADVGGAPLKEVQRLMELAKESLFEAIKIEGEVRLYGPIEDKRLRFDAGSGEYALGAVYGRAVGEMNAYWEDEKDIIQSAKDLYYTENCVLID